MTELIDLFADRSAGDITTAEISDYVERALRGELGVSHPREHKLLRRSVGALFYIIGTLMPDGHPQKDALLSMGRMPTTEQWVSLMEAAAKLEQAEVMVDTLNARADLRRAAWAVEDAQRRLDREKVYRESISEDGNDAALSIQDEQDVIEREAAHDVINSAPAEVLTLVDERAAARAAAQPAPEEPTEES